MATNKKSFVLYCDQSNAFKILSDEEAGRLIKHIFAYVNDENPEAPDRITEISFTPIKYQLKRDLIKWNDGGPVRIEKAHNAGLASGEARRIKKNLVVQNELNELEPTKRTANVNVTVNDNVTVSDRGIPPQTELVCNEFMKTFDDFTAMGQADKFINFYQSKGWMVGKNKMKDWKAAVRNWISRMREDGKVPKKSSLAAAVKAMNEIK